MKILLANSTGAKDQSGNISIALCFILYFVEVNVGIQWSSHSGKARYGASGTRDVLIIVSESWSSPDVAQRRAAIELTEEWRGKLENQGIAREDQSDDLSIVKARYSLSRHP